MDHISHSQANMLLKCGIQYEFRYIKGIVIPPSGVLVRGKCGHKAVEANLRQKIESEQDLGAEQVVQVFADEWEKQKYSIGYTEEELKQYGSPAKAEAALKDSGVGLTAIYHKEAAPKIKPLAVEEKFRVEFQGDFPALVGVIDVRERDQSVIDSKFTGKTPAQGEILTDVQLQTYQMGVMVLHKKMPKRIRKISAVALKTPKVVVQECPPYERTTIDRLLNRYAASINSIRTGVFAPAAPGVWWCSPKWCGYWRLCKYHP